jgi:hypothetical protein
MRKIQICFPGSLDGTEIEIPDGMPSVQLFDGCPQPVFGELPNESSPDFVTRWVKTFRPLLDETGYISLNDEGVERWGQA